MKSLLILLSSVCVLSACHYGSNMHLDLGNPPPKQPGEQEVGQQSLQGKSFEDVMRTKYNRAEMVCRLWSMLSSELDLQRVPNSQFRINLKNQFNLPVTFVLRSSIQSSNGGRISDVHRTEISISIYKIAIGSAFAVYDVASEQRYDYRYSPQIGYTANTVVRTQTRTGEVTQSFSLPENTANEKINTTIINSASDAIENGFGYKTRDYAVCTIETDIKPEYADQFSVTHQPNPEQPNP